MVSLGCSPSKQCGEDECFVGAGNAVKRSLRLASVISISGAERSGRQFTCLEFVGGRASERANKQINKQTSWLLTSSAGSQSRNRSDAMRMTTTTTTTKPSEGIDKERVKCIVFAYLFMMTSNLAR